MKALRALAIASLAFGSSFLGQISFAQGSYPANTRAAQWLQLTPLNGSGVTGLVALNASEQPGATDVMVGLNQTGPDMNYFAGMYSGTCSKPGQSAYALNRMRGGRSDTTLGGVAYPLLIDENGGAQHGPYAIIVSRTSDPKTALACADLKGQDKGAPPVASGGHGESSNAVDLKSSDGTKVVAKAVLTSNGSRSHVKVTISQPDAAADYIGVIYEGACNDASGVAFRLNKFRRGVSDTDLSAYRLFSRPTAPSIYYAYAIMLRLGSDQGAVVGCADFLAWTLK